MKRMLSGSEVRFWWSKTSVPAFVFDTQREMGMRKELWVAREEVERGPSS